LFQKTAIQWSMFSEKRIRCTLSYTTSLLYILILSFVFTANLSSGPILLRFSDEKLLCSVRLFYACHMHRPSHSPWRSLQLYFARSTNYEAPLLLLIIIIIIIIIIISCKLVKTLGLLKLLITQGASFPASPISAGPTL
jgi:hypothetical protein